MRMTLLSSAGRATAMEGASPPRVNSHASAVSGRRKMARTIAGPVHGAPGRARYATAAAQMMRETPAEIASAFQFKVSSAPATEATSRLSRAPEMRLPELLDASNLRAALLSD